MYRCDRSVLSSSSTRGGGVLLALNNKFISSALDVDVNSLELCFVSIKINNTKKLIISCVYFPPNSASSSYIDYFNILDNLISSCPNDDFLLFGDFNLPNLNNTSFNKNINPSSPESIFLENLAFLNLYQINTILNYNGGMLDLILSNISTHVITLNTDSIVPVDRYHPPLNVHFNHTYIPPSLSYSEITYNWAKGNYNAILTFLGSINWVEFFKQSNEISILIDEFYSLLYFTIESYIPKRSITKSKFPSWFSKGLIKLIKQKQTYHTIYKISNSSTDYLKFSSTRSQCKALSKLDYSRYLHNMQHSLKYQPNKLWSYIKNLKSSSGIPNTMSLNHQTADNGEDIANLFSSYFSSVYKERINPNTIFPSYNVIESPCSINKPYIELLDVFHELENLSYKTAIGPDGLSPIFLFNCRFVLAHPITYIFNSSIKNGSFPSLWKSTFVYPIFKKGNRSLVSNYRPISIISILPKIFSKIITFKITPLFKNILVPQQHGFRSHKSSTTNLITLKHHILCSFKNHQQTDVIYTDFEKAFDRVNHKLLIHKLTKIGFDHPLLSWLDSFLSERTQYVKLKNFISSPISVTSGVPQGDHLSPLLFNLFINDAVSSITHSNILLFADDAKIFKSIATSEDCILLQNDLISFNDWCTLNELTLNTNKCQVISYSKKRNPVNFNYCLSNINLLRSSLVKDLGIQFDSKLLFNTHILTIQNKALSLFGMIKRNCSEFNDPVTFKCLYTSLIRSLLEYAPIIWDNNNIGHNNQIEKVQNKVLRFICYKCKIDRTPHTGYNNILGLLKIDSLKTRRTNIYNSFLSKLLNNEIDDSFILSLINFKVPNHNTRNNHLFYIQPVSQSYMLNHPINTLMSYGNNLDDHNLFK